MNRPITTNNQEFCVTDLALAASLVTFGFRVKAIEPANERQSIFIFHEQPGIERTIQDFWNGFLKVEPRQFVNEMKNLKARIYSGV